MRAQERKRNEKKMKKKNRKAKQSQLSSLIADKTRYDSGESNRPCADENLFLVHESRCLVHAWLPAT